MNRRSLISLAASAVLAALSLAACGSSPLTPAQLRSRATSICLRSNRRMQTIVPPTAASGAKAFLSRGADALSDELGELSSLSTSGDAANVYRAALGGMSGELAALRSATHSLDAGADTLPALRSLAHRLAPLEVQANNAWRALQIPACLAR